ncbi:NAD(P)-binding domain-containing protein, partial [Nodularia spumigena]
MQKTTIAILGAGAWGLALADLASANGHQVRVWSRRGTANLETVIQGAEIILSAIAMKGVSDVVSQIQSFPLSPQ